MSTTVYAVHEYGGKWDDAYDNIVHLWSTHEAAEVHIGRIEVERAQQNELYDKQEAFLDQWDEQNPRPTRPAEVLLARKPWPAGLSEAQIIPEMRAERLMIEEHNQGVYRRQNEFDAVHTNAREDARLEFLRSLGLSGDQLLRIGAWQRPSWLKESKYTIDEMELD